MTLWKLRLSMLGTLTAIIGLSTLFFTVILSLVGALNLITLGLIVVVLNVAQWLIAPYIINAIYRAKEAKQAEEPKLFTMVERLSEKTNTLEGDIVKVVCELYIPNQPISFVNLWEGLTSDLEGKLDDKKPNKMDTPEFGEVTKQKIGYRLREILNGKKQRLRSSEGPYWAYSFDETKLGRIAKKYGCNLVLKFSSEPTNENVEAAELGNNLSENRPLRGNNLVLGDEKTEKPMDTPEGVAPVENSRTNNAIEDLASKAKELTQLTTDFGIETCVLCSVKEHPSWQVTLFDDSWGLLCGSCGLKLSERLSKNG